MDGSQNAASQFSAQKGRKAEKLEGNGELHRPFPSSGARLIAPSKQDIGGNRPIKEKRPTNTAFGESVPSETARFPPNHSTVWCTSQASGLLPHPSTRMEQTAGITRLVRKACQVKDRDWQGEGGGVGAEEGWRMGEWILKSSKVPRENNRPAQKGVRG